MEGQKGIKRRLVFSIEEKYHIIRKLQAGQKRNDICRDRNIPKSTIATIWQNRDSIVQAYEERNVTCKRMKRSAYYDVDQALFKWVNQKKKLGVQLTGATLQLKAEELGKLSKKKPNFRCSLGWIDRFKKRHNLVFKEKNSEECSVSPSTSSDSRLPTFKNENEDYESYLVEHQEVQVKEEFEEHNDFDEIMHNLEDGANNSSTNDTDFKDDHTLTRKKFAPEQERRDNMDSPMSSQQNIEEDEFGTFGRYIALSLKKLPIQMALMAQSDIQNTLTHYRISACTTTKADSSDN